jgi:hypothetical protein
MFMARNLNHLLQLEVVVGADRELQLVLLDAGVGALEVEAVGDFLIGLFNRVLQLDLVDFRDDIEGGHGCE